MNKVEWHGEMVKEQVTTAVLGRLLVAADLVETEAIRMMEMDPKTGRMYYRPARVGGGLYQASDGGESPAVRTGDLVASMDHTEPEVDVDAIASISIGSDLDYALYLEIGADRSDSKWHLAPRPFLRPSLDSNSKDIRKLFDTLPLG